jgi:Holliday junction resolvasome RuvABC endonuclease subunit
MPRPTVFTMPLIVQPDYSISRILSIDPGLNTTGIAVTEAEITNKHIYSIFAETLVTQKLSDRSEFVEDTVSERMIKLTKLSDAVRSIIQYSNPSIVVIENPFYNMRRPSAFGALMEVVTTLHRTVVEHNPNIYFITISPYEVKKSVKAGLTEGKDSVKEMMANVPEIMSKLICDFNQLDEHAIDAIGVMYAWLTLPRTQ